MRCRTPRTMPSPARGSSNPLRNINNSSSCRKPRSKVGNNYFFDFDESEKKIKCEIIFCVFPIGERGTPISSFSSLPPNERPPPVQRRRRRFKLPCTADVCIKGHSQSKNNKIIDATSNEKSSNLKPAPSRELRIGSKNV